MRDCHFEPQQPQRLSTPYQCEADVVSQLLGGLTGVLDWVASAQLARPWVQAVRANPPPFWAMESLLKEYPLSSAEGLALMRLAEALLRVPDVETAIALTADQLGRADFGASSDQALARLSSSAIALSKKFLPPVPGADTQLPGLFNKIGARTVVAATVRAVQLLGRQFVLGQTMNEAMGEAAAVRKNLPQLRFSYDMLGEGARTERDALNYLASYTNAIESIARNARTDRRTEQNDGISIKLSALHPRYEHTQRARVLAELVPRVWRLCEMAAAANINLTIDAEEVDRLELSLDVFEALAAQVAKHCPAWCGFGLALQAYQTRSLELVQHVIALARKYQLRLMCRLVKGAYWDAEVKRAQELGLPHYPVFTHKHHTDVSYLACAKALLDAPDAVYPQFASHNAATIAAVLQIASRVVPSADSRHQRAKSTESTESTEPTHTNHQARLLHRASSPASTASQFELQRLHGMGEGIFREVLKNPLINCRIYAPVGSHRDLLAYLVRRLLENGANSSFIHQLADESVSLDVLLTSPLRLAPQPSLPLPADLLGPGRKNSSGLDLAVQSMRAPLQAAWQCVRVPHVPVFDIKLTATATATALSSYQKWSKQSVASRATVLHRAADAMQQQLPLFCALLVKEAHKTWADAVPEVREAIDFLRYYAAQAERVMAPVAMPNCSAGATPWGVTGETNELRLVARGVWVCISPWNFPLAIFIGQVAAALVTGNAVLAKPAEQTPGIAWQAVQLLIKAGVPEGVLQLMHGPGNTVGAALVAAPGVAGVVFTGSTQVAKTIERALAAKNGSIAALIAETGGINAMLVDSSALPEQVTDAVMQSAFRSAGQRCSALRVLCVHEAIADRVIEMIQGAASELTLGHPADLASDVGPVIDAKAFDCIQQHLMRLKNESKVLLRQQNNGFVATDLVANDFLAIVSADTADTADAVSTVDTKSTHTNTASVLHLIAPAAFEVASLADIKHEIFGPVLHVVRWGSGELKDAQTVIDHINALGYGLTLGIQTRIDSRAQALADCAHVGNVYINRSMTGAVVGVQPFGGQGLSGTGPKAGGPHYLYRFCSEQTVTVNTTAAGGNAALLVW